MGGEASVARAAGATQSWYPLVPCLPRGGGATAAGLPIRTVALRTPLLCSITISTHALPLSSNFRALEQCDSPVQSSPKSLGCGRGFAPQSSMVRRDLGRATDEVNAIMAQRFWHSNGCPRPGASNGHVHIYTCTMRRNFARCGRGIQMYPPVLPPARVLDFSYSLSSYPRPIARPIARPMSARFSYLCTLKIRVRVSSSGTGPFFASFWTRPTQRQVTPHTHVSSLLMAAAITT